MVTRISVKYKPFRAITLREGSRVSDLVAAFLDEHIQQVFFVVVTA